MWDNLLVNVWLKVKKRARLSGQAHVMLLVLEVFLVLVLDISPVLVLGDSLVT
jgi:hypothetical protein